MYFDIFSIFPKWIDLKWPNCRLHGWTDFGFPKLASIPVFFYLLHISLLFSYYYFTFAFRSFFLKSTHCRCVRNGRSNGYVVAQSNAWTCRGSSLRHRSEWAPDGMFLGSQRAHYLRRRDNCKLFVRTHRMEWIRGSKNMRAIKTKVKCNSLVN